MIKTLTLNIGLNVNGKQPKGQLLKTLKKVNSFIGIDKRNVFLTESTYKGKKEPTLVVSVGILFTSLTIVKQFLEDLCTTLKQDCIPFKYENYKGIVFNKSFSGEKFEFNESLFITLRVSKEKHLEYLRGLYIESKLDFLQIQRELVELSLLLEVPFEELHNEFYSIPNF